MTLADRLRGRAATEGSEKTNARPIWSGDAALMREAAALIASQAEEIVEAQDRAARNMLEAANCSVELLDKIAAAEQRIASQAAELADERKHCAMYQSDAACLMGTVQEQQERIAALEGALRGVIRVADRKTDDVTP